MNISRSRAQVAITAVLAVVVTVFLHWRGTKLFITTTPGGADVLLDGRPAGASNLLDGNLTVSHVRGGKHTVVFRLAGNPDRQQEINIGFLDLGKVLKADFTSAAGGTREISVLASGDPNAVGGLAGKPSIEVGDRDLLVWYREAGPYVALTIHSHLGVMIHVDVDHDGHPNDNVDRTYAIDSKGRICSQHLELQSASLDCWGFPTKAAAHSSSAGGIQEEIWYIPKNELTQDGKGVSLAFELLGERQTSRYYPVEPFTTTYRFAFGGNSIKTPSWPDLKPAAVVPVEGKPRSIASGSSVGNPFTVPSKTPTPATVTPPPPTILSFQSDPASVEQGGQATLSWSVTGANDVNIAPDLGKVAAKGEASVSPRQTTQYTLTATGLGGVTSVLRSIDVVSVPAPLITSFQADSGSIQFRGKTTLRWAISGRTTGVRIDPGLGAVPAQGVREVSPERTTKFTITAQGPGGTVSADFTVTVGSPGPTITFDAEPESVQLGKSAILRWSVSGASRVTIEPGIGVINPDGSLVVKPLASTVYTLTAEGPGGLITHQVRIAVSKPHSSSGELIWTGNIHGTQLITIDGDHADTGTLVGALPGVPCIVQPMEERHVGVASVPNLSNNYERLVLRVTGNGPTRVVVKWSLQ
jgi:hypothetical protein